MTFTANQRLVTFLSVLAALFVTAVVSYNLGTDETSLRDRILTECEAVTVGEFHSDDEDMVGDDLAGILHSAGWRGNPDDGQDRLYSPACIFF